MAYVNLNDLKEREVVPGFMGKFVHSKNMTIAHWKIKAGSVTPKHKHLQEQVTIIIKGKLELTVEEKVRTILPNENAIIPANVIHAAKAITDCHVIDVFYPVREDYK